MFLVFADNYREDSEPYWNTELRMYNYLNDPALSKLAEPTNTKHQEWSKWQNTHYIFAELVNTS